MPLGHCFCGGVVCLHSQRLSCDFWHTAQQIRLVASRRASLYFSSRPSPFGGNRLPIGVIGNHPDWTSVCCSMRCQCIHQPPSRAGHRDIGESSLEIPYLYPLAWTLNILSIPLLLLSVLEKVMQNLQVLEFIASVACSYDLIAASFDHPWRIFMSNMTL
jgi:hypothetical protein